MFELIDGIKVLKTENLPENILSFTTTRIGGFSKGYYSELNMGFHVGDDKKLVEKNYGKLLSVFDIDKIQLLNQIHSDKVIEINKTEKIYPEADGLFTNKERLALGIMTADCYTVQLIGEKYISNLHCGWRSIYSGIVQNAISLFDKNNDKIIAAVIGVGICNDCYEVDSELAEKFNLLFPKKNIVLKKDNAYFLNLRKVLFNILKEQNINNILDLNYCSSCEDEFYSHRRDKGKTGRMLSVLMIR
jgi:YfiH family protein